MALETMVTGPYTGSYAGVLNVLGTSREGYRINHELRQQNIDATDHYGDSLIDYVYRGGNVTISFSMLSYTKALTAGILWPFGANIYTLSAAATPVGRLASDLAGELILTVVPNTPADTLNAPNTITANKSILAPGFNFELLYDSRLREVPVRLALLPYTSGGAVVWAVTT